MIGKLIGKIDSVYDDKLILNVGGVGYNVFASSKTLASLPKNSEIALIIETIVREDHIHLYGFKSEIERAWFNELCKVKGVGSKVALKILSVIEINDIILALASGDKNHFSTVPGIGPKLALRIVSELKDSVGKMDRSMLGMGVNLDFNGDKNSGKNNKESGEINNSALLADAVSALENLGYKRMEIYKVVSENLSQNPNSTLENLITNSLRKISK